MNLEKIYALSDEARQINRALESIAKGNIIEVKLRDKSPTGGMGGEGHIADLAGDAARQMVESYKTWASLRLEAIEVSLTTLIGS